MTVKELIEELKTFDENLTVIRTEEESYEPNPTISNLPFDHDYYTGSKFVTIPKNTSFVEL